jgi:hypothetical protein
MRIRTFVLVLFGIWTLAYIITLIALGNGFIESNPVSRLFQSYGILAEPIFALFIFTSSALFLKTIENKFDDKKQTLFAGFVVMLLFGLFDLGHDVLMILGLI